MSEKKLPQAAGVNVFFVLFFFLLKICFFPVVLLLLVVVFLYPHGIYSEPPCMRLG